MANARFLIPFISLPHGACHSAADARDILPNGLIAAMDEVGRLYAQGTFFVPEILMAGHAMKAGLSALRPHLENAEIRPQGCVVIGTVQGDPHDIGKNLVAMMPECARICLSRTMFAIDSSWSG